MDEADYLQYYDVDQLNGAVGRFISFQLNFEEFLRHPIIGLGGYTEGTWLAQNYEIATISGIGEMLVFFGAIMTAVFVFLLIKSCKLILTIIESDNAWLLIVVVLGMMVSYSLWKQPIFIAFWLFGYYSIAPPEQYDYDDEEDEEMSNQDDKQI